MATTLAGFPLTARTRLSKFFTTFGFLLAVFAAGTALTGAPVRAEEAEPAPDPMCLPKTFSLRTGGAMERTADRLARRMGLKVLAIGSSSTEGIGASSPQKSYPAQLAVDLGARMRSVKVDVRNAGIGGETIDKTIVRLQLELERYKPDLVIWQVGTNDAITAGNSEAQFRTLIESGVRATRSRGVDMILIDPQYFPKIADVGRYERYVGVVKATAEENHIGLFPRYRLMKAIDAQVEGGGGIMPLLSKDSFHMGDRGYACLADLLTNQIMLSVAQTARVH
ncbi:SGNH/GDSL hydrolase family protein [Methyloraptor flagellatus]|uniref:SGNH/GDSL hydrolase family protein n=1 Tax=Methyloraptor flagellatus TaxID=3162530 RepID=A0AAU7XGR9_9HYPH